MKYTNKVYHKMKYTNLDKYTNKVYHKMKYTNLDEVHQKGVPQDNVHQSW